MKSIKICCFILMIMALLSDSRAWNYYKSLNAGVDSHGPDFTTPVIFVHGLSSIGGDTFYNMYEKFAAYGFPENKMAVPLLPRINAGTFDENYAWYAPASVFKYTAAHWKGNYVNADELKNTIDRLAPGPGVKVNLVGHSNGSAVILKLLAKYPEYSFKIKKIVFISGFADVSAADGRDNIVTDLHNCMPFKNLPADIEYYAISSESDANISLAERVYGKPSNDNPDPYHDTIRYWQMNDADGIAETNLNVTGLDHQGILTCNRVIEQVFEWLTGSVPPDPRVLSTVTIGGRIVLAVGCSQQVLSSGLVKLEYYDPSTGAVTGTAGRSPLSSDGRYFFSGVNSSAYLKMTVRANGGTNVYFFADRRTYNNCALDFNAPERLAAGKSDGMVSVQVICRYSYLSSSVYKKRRGDSFSGRVRAEGCSDVILDSSCIPMSAPSSYLSVNLANYGSTDTTTGTGNTFNFATDKKNRYTSKNVYVTADLQNTGTKTVIQINGADRKNNIKNHIVYLYPPQTLKI